MIKNYIPENISFLVKKMNISQDEFGATFEISRGLISNYINGKALPKIEAIQRICLHFEILIDDFINTDLSIGKPYAIKDGKILSTQENKPDPYVVSPRYVELLEKSLEDKDKIIKALELQIGDDKQNKTA